MCAFAGLVVTQQMRFLVRAHAERLAPVHVCATGPLAQHLASFDLATFATLDPAGANAALVVGLPAAILKHVRNETREFGFVMPVARVTKPWQRGAAWRDDTTLDLWTLGWSLVAIDRLVVPVADAEIEMVIGSARRTPPAPGAALASEDAD